VKLQTEGHETRQGFSVQGGGEGRGVCVAHMHKVPRTAESEHGRLWQRACAQLWPSPSALRQLLRQPLLSMPSGLDNGLAFAEGQGQLL